MISEVSGLTSALSRAERWRALGQRGATVLLTGLPAAGKSTIAAALERELISRGQAAYVLDGDRVRQDLSADLGFSPEDRTEHLRRVGVVAQLFADAGAVSILALIAPRNADREALRRAHAASQLTFVEVFVDTPLPECERRDPKGLYTRARRGEIEGFTGVDGPYDAPENPDVHVRTTEMSVEDMVGRIAAALERYPTP